MWTLGAVVVLFAVVHFGGGLAVKWVLNRKLAEMDTYTGHVGSVGLALWHGGVTVDDFVLRDREKPDEPPLVKVRHASFSVAMRPLLSGKVGGEGVIDGMEVIFAKHHMFAGPVDAAKKAGEEVQEKKAEAKRWQDVLADKVPFEIHRFEVRNSRVRYIDRAHQPNVDVSITDLRLVASGLGNRPKQGEPRMALLDVTGIMTGNGKMKLHVEADVAAATPQFSSTFEVRELSLPEFNSFLRAYASADVSKGTFEMYSELKAAEGRYQGYVKPFLRDLDFKNVTDKNKKFTERAKEKVVSAVSSLLKNDEEGKVATVTPFSGTLGDNKVGIWETVHNLLRNAFVEALREGFQGQR